MCGIAGMIDLTADRRPAPAGAVERMTAALYHRGPDDDGFLPRPGLGLGNRRLSIVGLADGKQPISNEDETVWTVFNGELYDYADTRKLLEGRGHVFRTHTDTELIPHLWEDHREGFLDHIKGQFAVCVWDSKSNEFLLARDRAGICPLFTTTVKRDGSDWLLFASEIKGLLASGFIDPRPDVQGLNHVFTFFAMPGPTTVFQGVQSLPPGEYLHFTPGKASPEVMLARKTYWRVTYPDRGQELDSADGAGIVKGFEEVLYKSVQRRLTADVPVVSYLSGGVDSSLIVAMACKVLGRPIPTFTVSVQSDTLNEESPARATAQYLGCSPEVVNIGHDELRSGYPELIRAAEYPVIDTSCLGLMHLARAVRATGYKVALTGEGADEWLGGYWWFKLARLTGWAERIPGLPLGYLGRKWAMRLAGHPIYPRALVKKVQNLVGGHNGWLDVYGIMSLSKLRFFTPAVTEQLLARSPYEDLDLSPDLHRWHPFNRQMYLGARVMLPGHLLAGKGDRVSMHNSVEARYPFLDEDVIAYMAKLHPRWKLRGLRRDKYVERKAAEAWLPKEVAWRRKFMFLAPMDSWAAGMKTTGAADAWVEQVLSPESVKKTNLFDHTSIQTARETLLKMRPGAVGRTGLEMGLTAVVATQVWHHLYIKGDLADMPGAARG